MEKNYNQSHRILEVIGILVFLILELALFIKLFQSSLLFENIVLTILFSFITVILSYLSADFISGYVHFLGDNFLSENSPILGEAFIRPFREHHTDPKAITRHDFIETNGNNCLVSIPPMLGLYFLFPIESKLSCFTILFLTLLFLFIFITNQIHKWAHESNPSKLISFLQNHHLILNPIHHKIHHTKPYNKYYCITTGWLNPILYKIRFFEWNRIVLGKFLPLSKD
ncbi:MAG: fatty acid desaturase CarF family protein [Leptospiraceae bacterium]|nr:fatty acid desaturase CarF family protein [Leptospiraceae bacterium]